MVGMKITTKNEPKASINYVPGSAFPIETPDHLPSLNGCFIATGRRGIGKSVALTSLFTMYKEHLDVRVLLVSSTAESNKKLLTRLDVAPEDIFDPDQVGVVQRLIAICEEERDSFVQYRHLKENYERIMKQIRHGIMPTDDYLMEFYDFTTNQFRMPEPKYPCYKKGKPVVLLCLIDDAFSSKLFRDPALTNLVVKHRHIASLPEGGALGITLAFTVQSWRANNGIPPPIRNNATGICVFSTRSEPELQSIQESFGGEVSKEAFYAVYNKAIEGSKHNFLFIDAGKLKGNQPSMFRKNFDEYLIVEENGVK